jgi:hypothetical protein
MPDTSLGRALAELVDDVEAGDSLRERIERRERRGWRRPHLLAVAAVVVLVALVAGVVVVASRRDEQRKTPVVVEPGPEPKARPRPAGGSWAPVAPAPKSAHPGAISVWTGREVLVWGGAEGREVQGSGAAYDPVTDRWRSIPDAPIEAIGPAFAWTGSELVVWSGSRMADGVATGGAAYDPTTDRWRSLAAAPIAARQDAAFGWTGSELVIWGGDDLTRNFDDGAAYNTRTDTWRTLPELPLPGGPAAGAAVGDTFTVRSLEGDATAQIDLQSWEVDTMPSAPRNIEGEGYLVRATAGVYGWGWTDTPANELEASYQGWWYLNGKNVWEPARDALGPFESAPPSHDVIPFGDGILTSGRLWYRTFQQQGQWVQIPDPGFSTSCCAIAAIEVVDQLFTWFDIEGVRKGARYLPDKPQASRGYDLSIWPVFTSDDLEAYERDHELPTTAEEAAVDFAREALGWDASVRSTRYFNVDRSVLEIVAGSLDGEVIARRVESGYVIEHVNTLPIAEDQADEGLSVSIQAGHATVHHAHEPPLGGSVDIVLRKGANVYRADRLSTADAEFENVDATDAGSLTILYRDATGRLVDALGISLPRGEFAAG